MCIAFLAISDNPQEDGYKVIIAMNRDEYFDRPTKEAQFYEGNPDIIAGFDICSGSDATWLGMSKNGRIGLLTNYRQSEKFMKRGAKRRGKLVTDFLKSGDAPHRYLEKVKESGKDYKGFNLIVGNVSPGNPSNEMEFGYYCNQENEPFDNLKPGVHALSNRYLDYEWKKVRFGKERFQEIIKRKSSVKEKANLLIEMLQDETKYPDDELFVGPQDDGISQSFLESFTAISVLITEHPSCGTRTNTVIIVDNQDNTTFVERTMVEPIDPNEAQWKTNAFHFKMRR